MFEFNNEVLKRLKAGFKFQNIFAKIKNNFPKGRYIAIGLVLALSVSLAYYQLTKPNAYAVLIEGDQVAVVSDQAEAEGILKDVVLEKSKDGPVKYVEEITYQPVRVKGDELTGPRQLNAVFREQLHYVTTATAIVVNGQEIGIVHDRAAAEQVIADIKNSYLPQEQEELVLETAEFEEEISFESRQAGLGDFSDPVKLKELVINGTEYMELHTVEAGESLWAIARNNGLTVEELKDANPDLKSELLSIGQQLRLIKAEPLLHLVTTYNLESQESIPYKTEFETDSDLWRGQERVRKPGIRGEKLVEYKIVERNGSQLEKEIVNEQIIKEPETRIVLRGTKVIMASRGDGGSGELAWPLRGSITSRFGYRGREFHTGLDINGNTGDPIYAAEAGKIIFAGWDGNYGHSLVIDHGDGLATRYAHNSALKIKVGDQVKRGDLIALVGSTGRSTGSHLHFEVMVNGNFQNPLNYLR